MYILLLSQHQWRFVTFPVHNIFRWTICRIGDSNIVFIFAPGFYENNYIGCISFLSYTRSYMLAAGPVTAVKTASTTEPPPILLDLSQCSSTEVSFCVSHCRNHPCRKYVCLSAKYWDIHP